MVRNRYLVAFGLFGFMLLQGCAEADHDSEEALAVQEQAIVGGTEMQQNPYFVAVYHKSYTKTRNYHWYGRPCSGTILRRSQGTTWILTARHCVVREATLDIYTPHIPPADVRVTTQIKPGVLMCTRSGCYTPSTSTTFAAIQIYVPTPLASTVGQDGAYDLAIVQVPQDLVLSGGGRLGVDFSPVSALASVKMRRYGYGRGVYNNDASDEPELSGVDTRAGILRSGFDFTNLSYIPADLHTYFSNNVAATPSGAYVTHGDSGGPATRYFTLRSVKPSGTTTYNWEELTGVQHSTQVDCAVSAHANWLQSVLKYVYLSPIANTGMNLGLSSGTPAAGASLSLVSGDAINTRWNYNPDTQQLRIYRGAAGAYDNLCLTDMGATAQLAACVSGSSAQKWTVRADHGIASAAGTCLWHYESAITLGACNGSYPTFWGWHFEA